MSRMAGAPARVLARRPVMADIAAAAGVSKDTVSRALGRKPGVRPEVRHRIEKLASRMGYRPNPLVRAFHQRASRLVGVFSVGSLGLALGEVLEGIQRALGRRDYDPVLIGPHAAANPGGTAPVPRVIHERYIDGLIALENLPADLRAEIRHHDMPVVLALGDPVRDPDAMVVTHDPAASVAMAVEHLVQLGHRRIAGVFIGPVQAGAWAKLVSRSNPWTRGYLRAMARHGLVPTMAEHPCLEPDRWLDQVLGAAPGAGALSAIITQDISGAHELRPALARRGLGVPGQISLIATNLSGTDVRDPGTYHTTIDQHWAEVGQAAAEAIVERLEGRTDGDWAAMRLFEPAGVLDYATTAPARRPGLARRPPSEEMPPCERHRTGT